MFNIPESLVEFYERQGWRRADAPTGINPYAASYLAPAQPASPSLPQRILRGCLMLLVLPVLLGICGVAFLWTRSSAPALLSPGAGHEPARTLSQAQIDRIAEATVQAILTPQALATPSPAPEIAFWGTMSFLCSGTDAYTGKGAVTLAGWEALLSGVEITPESGYPGRYSVLIPNGGPARQPVRYRNCIEER